MSATRSLLLFVFLLFSWTVSAQQGDTEDKKAKKYYDAGMEHLRYGQYELAEMNFRKAIERDAQYLHPKFDLAQIYLFLGKEKEAKRLMEEIVTQDPSYSPAIFMNLAMMESINGNYAKAKQYYELFLPFAEPGSENEYKARLGIASSEFAQHAIEHPVEYNPQNLGSGVNTASNEYFPALTADESLLLFTRLLEDPRSPDGYDEDFFFSEKAEGKWLPAYNPGRPINSPYKEGAPTLSPDGKYIIFTACELYGEYGPGKQGYGSCDLFISERIGNRWSNPVNMGRSINSQHWETQPSFASDGKTLYFIRGKKTREGVRNADIYVSELKDKQWTPAVPLPDNINSNESEESVFIHPDNKTLYFSSSGHIGMGDMDIYISRRQKDGSWGNPVNLGYPINTGGQENSFHVSASGTYALIASDREGGYGGLDLYSFELPEAVRPNRITYLKGTITDAKTKKPLEARFELIDLATGDTVVRSYSDEGDGSFLVVLPSNAQYALLADREGYLYHSENFELQLDETTIHYQKNIELQPIEAGRSVVLRNVFFDTDKYELKPASKTELNKLTKLLNDNPAIRIEVSGHTDNQGTTADNVVLSKNRAKAVYDYLVRAGIAPERLAYKGYGESQPVSTNDTEEGRALNRRTEFKVVE